MSKDRKPAGKRGWWLVARKGLRIAGIAAGAYAALVCVLIIAYTAVAPPASATMLWRLLQGQGLDYRWTSIDTLPSSLQLAVIVSEDSRFCDHNGVDWGALGSVWDDVLSGDGKPRGASTIPMQTVKNLFLWPWRSYVRKAVELPLAYAIDTVWPKRRIIEIYLNIAEWGPGIYGAEAAARAYFGRSADKLTSRQSALLAAALPNPAKRNPGKPNRYLHRKANTVAARMRGAGGLLACL